MLRAVQAFDPHTIQEYLFRLDLRLQLEPDPPNWDDPPELKNNGDFLLTLFFGLVGGPAVAGALTQGIMYFKTDEQIAGWGESWVGGNDISHGVNIGVCPDGYSMMFDAVPSEALGIEYDASHLYWQRIDHIRFIHEFGPRIHHVHLKDVEILPERMYRRGCTGGSFRFRIPGWGEVKWQDVFTALMEEGYQGNMVIEHEDPLYSSRRKFDEGLRLAHDYLRPIFPSW